MAQCVEKEMPVLPAKSVYASAGDELGLLAGLSGKLQDDISELLKGHPKQHSAEAYRLQNLDRITQVVADLSRFFRVLAADTPEGVELNVEKAMQALILADVAARFAKGIDIELDKTHMDGDCDFF